MWWSFLVFVVALVGLGLLMICSSLPIIFWNPQPEALVIYGWIFLGAAAYFLWGLIVPRWHNAAGQLLGFLAYDLVLIVPFALHFRAVSAELLVQQTVYIAVIIYSAALAIFYCFVHPPTRLRLR